MANSIETVLAQYMARAIQLGLGLDPSQVTISAQKIANANWVQMPMYQVVPGAERPDGGGQGAQEGGQLNRVQRMSVYIYMKLDLDQYSYSEQRLINPTQGELNLFENLRKIFAMTYVGNQDGSQCLLSEPMYFVSESLTNPEDQNTGLVSREFVWDCKYNITAAIAQSGITVFQSQVANQLD